MTPHKFGRYEIKSELGRGGMATVYHAYDPRFRRDVALKVLPREFMHDPNFRIRFEREAQTIAVLEHPAIVPVYDFGEENGQLYLVMRFLPGGTLTGQLVQGALSLAQATHIINRLAPALDEAHGQGIIHRDLKPDNILFDQRDDPFITDFGIVKLSEGSSTITTGGIIIGTPAYMSPEQARGEEQIDGRSDIYALGVILFQMLTGKLPYDATTPIGLVMKHILDPVSDILEVKPDLPSGCEPVIAQAMAKERDKRYATATALAAAFAGSAGPRPLPQPDIPKITVPPPAPKPQAYPPEKRIAITRTMKIKKLVGTDDTIVCSKCQTPNHSEMRFCSNCGHQLKVDCIMCHTQNRIDATHCSNCGTNLKRTQTVRRESLEAKRQAQAEREQAFREKEARQRKEKIQRLINDLDTPAKHAFTIYQLNQLGHEAIEALIGTLLNSSHPHTRCGSAKALDYIYDEQEVKGLIKAKTMKALIKALTDSEPVVRYWAAKTLSHFKGQPGRLAVEPLAALLKDSHEDVREQARISLQEIGEKRAREILAKSKGFMSWIKGS